MAKDNYALTAVRSSIALFLLTALPVFGATGTIFYNSSTGSPAKTLRAVSADGSNSREIPLSVPSPALPTVSRDGRSLLVTSGGPLSSVMLSQNVYSIDLATGATVPITHYLDTVTIDTVVYTNLNTKPDPVSTAYYTTHLPSYKAYSPAGDRVVVMDHSAVSGKTPGGVLLASVTSPVLEVYAVQQTVPLGDRLFTGAERTGLNQAGDGVDWHPVRNELVGAFRANIPSFSSFGESQTEGTVIFVSASSGLNPLQRKLTNPTGRSEVDFQTFQTMAETEQDYAPAISRDGGKVAYVRNTLTWDAGGLIFRLVRCAIRIVNYDGSGDRELVAFGNNLWISKVAWSPDDTELAFDIAPRLVSNGLELQLGDLARSEIHIVRVGDGSIRLLAPAPAAYPSWSPLSSAPTPVKAPEFRATRTGNQIDLQLSNLVIGQQFDLEATTDLARWTTSQTLTASAATHSVSVPLSGQGGGQFFRVRLR